MSTLDYLCSPYQITWVSKIREHFLGVVKEKDATIDEELAG